MSKRAKKLGSRILAIALLVCMIVTQFAFIPTTFAATTQNTEIQLNTYSSDLYIYNYLCYTDGTGTLRTNSTGGMFVIKGSSSFDIYIGDVKDAEGDKRPMDSDIDVELNGLTMASEKALTVSAVNSGKRKVDVTVRNSPSIPTLVIEDNAKLTITLYSDITIDLVTLDEGSSLVINTNGYTANIDRISGYGDLTVSGNGRFITNSVSAGDVLLNTVTVQGKSSSSVTANKSITVNGATIKDLELFGFNSSATGNKTINFNGGKFENVTTVGVDKASNAVVTVSGFPGIVSSTETKFIFDYLITYKAAETVLTPMESWPTSYRVEYDSPSDTNTEVLGYISDGKFTNAQTVILPGYDGDAFYGYAGWLLNDTPITELSITQKGDITLLAKLDPNTVTVDMDLGYTPDTSTNDTPVPPKNHTNTVETNGTITLEAPKRFGYVFKGWKIISGTRNETYTGSSYTVNTDDLEAVAGTETFLLKMEAQWEEDSFPVRFILTSTVREQGIDISINGGEWIKLTDFINLLPDSISYDNGIFSPSEYMNYGETLDDYVKRIFGGEVLIRDIMGEYTFTGWMLTDTATPVSPDEEYRYGGGFLIKPDSVNTLDEWQVALKKNPVSFSTIWRITDYKYTLTVQNKGNWTVLIDGTPNANSQIEVSVNSTVTLSYQPSTTVNALVSSITHWAIPSSVGTVTEREYSSGDGTLYYDFKMPDEDIIIALSDVNTSSSTDPLMVDLSKSDIKFDTGVTYNNRVHNGFWYDVDSDDITPLFYDDVKKSYFYIWNPAEPFYVTTNGEATQNQLIVAQQMGGGIHLVECNMAARQEYLDYAVGRKLNGVLMEKNSNGAPSGLFEGFNMSPYGNIVIGNDKVNAYTTTIYVHGWNTVAAIFPSEYHGTYLSTLNINGDNPSTSLLTLGTVTCLGKLNINTITINSALSDSFSKYEYLIYTVTSTYMEDDTKITDAVINAPEKRLYNSFEYVNINSSSYNVDIDLGSMFITYGLKLNGGTKNIYLRVREDIVCNYYLVDMYGNSSLVVDGGIYSNSISTSYGNGELSNNGYLIVKGIGIVGTNLKVSGTNTTVISNLITSNRGGTFSNGVIVTNHLANPPVRNTGLSNGFQVIGPYTSSSSSSYPFYSIANTQTTTSTYTFSGSKVYLFGYHKGTSNVYDVTSSLKDDPNNPVKAILDPLLDANSDLKESLRMSPKPNDVATQARAAVSKCIDDGTYSDKECVQIGEANHTSESSYPKTVKISGGEIYAAGSLTFFNETTVTGGTVVCGGTFSTKRDLIISGGNITADEVGIADALTVTESGAKRYGKLKLSGGTITTGHIGALNKKLNGVTARGVLDLDITSTLNSNSANPIGVSTDLYFNYFYDANTYSVNNTNPVFLRFEGTYKDSKLQSLAQASDTSIAAPTLKAGGNAMWLYNDTNGEKINSIAVNGLVNGTEGAENVLDRFSISVYAAKTNYNLSIKGDYNGGFTVSFGETVLNSNTSESVIAQSQIKVTLDNAERYERTVIWYKDAAGLVHNISKEADPGTYTYIFTMPYSDVEIFITREFNLILDEYPIVFTDTGFGVEEKSDTRREDSLFDYSGNILITQSKTAVTYNKIAFETPGSGNVTKNISITFKDVNQSILGSVAGIDIANGAKVEFTISNSAPTKVTYLAPISVPENSSLTIRGSGNNSFAYSTKDSTSPKFFAAGHLTSKAGDISYIDLILKRNTYSYYAYSYSKTSAKVLYENCELTLSGYYTYDRLGRYMGGATVRNCTFNITTSTDLGDLIFDNCGDVYYYNSVVNYKFGGSRSAPNIFSNSSGITYIEDSTFNISYNRSVTSSTDLYEVISLNANVVASGNSIINSNERIMLKSLVLSDNAQLIADGGNGYLLCPDITVRDNAKLNVGYLILSGFISTSYDSESNLSSAFASGNVVDGNSYKGLTVNGGTVIAKYLGGAKNAKTTINGGTVNASYMGTLGDYYGYWKYIPWTGDNKFMHTYSVVPENMGATVNITGGSVSISEGGYLGGMFSTVNVTGGSITLGNNAVLGITEAQKTTMYNNATSKGQLLTNAVNVTASSGRIEGDTINTPYGSTTLTGAASAKVDNLKAENGNITITTSDMSYENPYTGSDRTDTQTGVVINGILDGLTVLIDNGAVVYANDAYTTAEIGKNGSLTVSNNAHLYIGTEYGSRGNGNSEVVILTNGYIYGNTIYYITYILMDDDIDKATNHSSNQVEYNWGQDNITLYDPTRPGYDFAGWYGKEDYTDEKVNSIATNAARNVTLYAKWIPKTVKVVVKINASDVGMNAATLITETQGISGTISGEVFTYERVAYVSYRELILGEGDGHINLANYMLATLGVKELKIDGAGNKYVDGNTTITKDMLDGDLVLLVTKIAKTKIKLSLDLNLVVKGEYSYSNYNNIKDFDEEDSITLRSSYVDIGATVSTANGFVDALNKLIVPTAAGFTFGGWYTDKSFADEYKISEDFTISADFNGTIYAKWIANEYYIEFDAGVGNDITSDGSVPSIDYDISRLVAKITYNSTIDTAKYFFKLENGEYVEITPEIALTVLPSAWAEGYTFGGTWHFVDYLGYERNISKSTIFNITNIDNGIAWYENTVNTGDPVSVISFLPKYARINITYDLNGGTLVGDSWKQYYGSITTKNGKELMTINEANKALIGYLNSTDLSANASDYVATSTVVNDHNQSFLVISTSSSYFAANSNYVTDDYRSQISQKGYTFKGWRLMKEIGGGVLQPVQNNGNDVYIGCFPRYEDIIVQAVWEANQYTVNLNPYKNDKAYEYSKFSHSEKVTVPLIVGKQIENLDTLWPSRETEAADPWYAYDATKDPNSMADNDKRYLLGFTFDALDPGVNNDTNTDGFAVYRQYSEDVTNLINLDCVYTHRNKETLGSIFGLPSDADYSQSTGIDGIDGIVPDYPNGSTIEMYAVYRERSLVFVEYYTDNNGEIQQKVLKSYPWEIWVDFINTDEYFESKAKIEGYGYTLLKLGVNSKDVNASEYPSNATDYNTSLEGYKTAAQNLGTYDIMIYTIFVAQVEVDGVILDASSNPLVNTSEAFEYVVPNSMQVGVLNYTITDLKGLTIVGQNELERFDSTVGNNEIAIYAELYNSAGERIKENWLDSSSVNAINMFDETAVGSGWTIKLTLYHSSVMTKEESYGFKLKLGFNELEDQHITLNTTINMTPSLYTVVYEAKLPSNPIVGDDEWNGFSNTSPYILTVNNFKYGDALTSTVPVVEGYDANNVWKSDANKEIGYGSSLIADTDAENAVNNSINVIRLTTEYIIKKFQLSASEELLDKWDIYYGATKLDSTNPVEVDYRTEISFAIKTQVGEYPEFAWIRIGDTPDKRVDTYGKLEGGKYVFTMPANNVKSYYSRLIELYLELGNISINAEGYSLNEDNFVWRGDYGILMDENNNTDQSETSNVLTFTGNLSDRKIYLGDLNITSENSISLDNATVTLTAKNGDKESRIKAKNIAIPYTSSVIIDGGSFILEPESGDAAIGGTAESKANGKITLSNATLDLTMNPSESSGIGPADKASGGEDIKLTGCIVTVTEKAGIGSSYSGTWIGGNGVSNVELTSTDILLGNESDIILGPTVLDGDAVTLVGCDIGTESAPLIDPIHAKNTLTIKDTSIHQSFNKGVAIGTEDNGTISVTNSIISSMVINPDSLYTGKLLINDIVSRVVIANTRILEAKHGDITITSTGVTQGSVYFAHTRSYLVINEIDGAVNDLTVDSVANTTDITVNDADFENVNINTDIEILLMGAIKLGTLTVSDGKTVEMDASSGAALTITEIDGTTSGSYVQNGGTLTGGKLGIGGDMTLTNVTVTDSEYIGSFGVGGVTTVTIDGGRVTSAGTIGALGEHNKTFTFVVIDNTSTISGTLVQDHYRINYNSTFGINDLPTVLRSETKDGNTTYTPSVPNGPTGDTNFLFWYFMNNDTKYGIGNKANGFTTYIIGLTNAEIAYADAEASDGTRTLQLYAWVNITIDGVISAGNIYNEFNTTSDTVTIYPTGAFTAMYKVSGSVMANSSYVIILDTPFKKGTVLTLGVLSDSVPTFYYYYCTGEETKIELSSFKKMGTDNVAPTLLSAAAGTKLEDVLIIVADFMSVADNESVLSHNITLKIISAGSDVASDDVSYNTITSSTVKDEGGKVVISHNGDSQFDGEKLYLIVNISGNTSIPFNAAVSFGENLNAIKLSENSWYIEIGNAKDTIQRTLTPEYSGFNDGEYTVHWTLVRTKAPENNVNVIGTTVAEEESKLTLTEAAKSEMSIALITVDNQEEVSRILTGGAEHIATFMYYVSPNVNIDMIGEMLTEDGGYQPVEAIGLEQTDTEIKAIFGSTLDEGTYRVSFSIDPDTTDDNIYFVFIIE